MKTIKQINKNEMSMKNANNKKTIDGYLVADFAAIVAIIFFICCICTQQKKYFILSTIATAIAASITGLQAAKGSARIKNNSSNCIFAKDESSSGLIMIEPNKSHAGLDGICTGGKVYKIPDGTHARITLEGKVKINSFIGNFVYLVFGGELNVSPDAGWNNLFDVKL